MVEIKFKKLNNKVPTPKRATDGACGFDLTATSMSKIYNIQTGTLQYIEYGTGICVQVPKGYCALAMPRSNVSNTPLYLSNGVGLIDNDYTGEITYRFKCAYTSINEYKIGDRIGQLLVLPLPEVEFAEVSELETTVRGDDGYGSTGIGGELP